MCVSEFKKVYGRLNVENLVDRGESFYQELMGKTVQKLDQSGTSAEGDSQADSGG